MSMTGSRRSGVRLALDLVLYRLMRPFPMLQTDRLRTIAWADGSELRYRLNRGEVWAVYEVWMRRCYQLPFPTGRGVLVDLGTNVGLTAVWMSRSLGFETVLGVEPSPSNQHLAVQNLAANAVRGEVLLAAVGPTDTHSLLRVYNISTFNELVFDVSRPPREAPGLRLLEEVEVPVLSMSTVLDQLGGGRRVDLLKLDIEGGEQDLLMGDLGWLAQVDAVVAEFHPPYADIAALVGRLESAGFVYVPPAPSAEMHSFRRAEAVF